AIDGKIAGKQIVANEAHEPAAGGAQVIDLVEALRASLGKGGAAKKAAPAKAAEAEPAPGEATAKERKGVRRAAKVEEAAPARARAKK
ncbi:MAG TPA: Ku protein, partial [Caldimonas sp.]